MTMTCVITGAAGFIGSHLATRLLGEGWHVVGIDNFDPFYDRQVKTETLAAIESPAFRFHEADIVDRDAMARIIGEARPDLVVHLAALAGVRPSLEAPDRFTRINLDGLVSVLDATRAAGCGRVLFASSSSVYGNSTVIPFTEADPVDRPISPYAATKRAGELLCHTYHHLFDMSIACLRFFTVFGPRQRPDLAISLFMRAIARGEAVRMFGDGTTSRDYTFIADIVDGIMGAGTWTEAQEPRFGLFNLGGSSPVTLAAMIDAIAKTVGRPAHIERHPMQPGDVNRTFADLTRSAAAFGYAPRTTFEEGLARQWEWLAPRL